MKKFLKVFALCALCVFALPAICSAQNKSSVITATKDDVYDMIRSLDKDCTIELVGEINENTITEIRKALDVLAKKNPGMGINLDMSKTTELKRIPENSFCRCHETLKGITIPSSVEIIENYAFAWCTSPAMNLTALEIRL